MRLNKRRANCIKRNIRHPALIFIRQQRKSDRTGGLIFIVKRFKALGADICLGFYFNGNNVHATNGTFFKT